MGDDRHPSAEIPDAIGSIKQIKGRLGADPLVFLDFDGTLSPIVENYNDAVIAVSVRTTLSDLSERHSVVIISGRAAADVKGRVGLPTLTYAGSHGQEIEYPDGTRYEHPDSIRTRGQLDGAERALRARLGPTDGINLERKPFGVAIHTREVVLEGDRHRAAAAAASVLDSFPDLTIRTGKEVIELRPDNDWDKGSAIEFLHRSLGRPSVIFIGDDETDEDGFSVVNRLGGVTVLVAPHPERPTLAQFILDDTDSVAEFLEFL
jgi:trehalose-phosphatase